MRIDIHPEGPDDVQQIRGWAAMGMPTGSVDPMYRATVLACTKWVDEHPDLMSLNPGSIVKVPQGIRYIVQPTGKWLRLPGGGELRVPLQLIDPMGSEWSDAEVEWAAS